MKKLSMDELNRLSKDEFKEIEKQGIIVLLDNIRSMHNIGSIFRSSDAFAIEAIVLCGITAQPPHREIEKTALGATESVKWWYEKDAIEACKSLQAKGYKVLCIEQVENSIALQNFKRNRDEKYVLVLGNEVEGVQQEIINIADAYIEIPQFGTKHSFNVSVTAGIVLWEMCRIGI